ncbi:hypothetical protein ACFPU0_03550 [Pseudomonas sp. GCM10022186]|uniref:hypothetical protein n=1 Tax=Pseudomonas sp. GCM10022186 TaxID=3252650 RepID=UPI00362064D4
MDPEALYHQLGHHIASMPDLNGDGWNSPEVQRWLGRAAALIEAGGDIADIAAFKVACGGLGGVLHNGNVQTITTVIFRALARAELAAPATAQGSFIPAGEPFSALAAVSKVLGAATRSVLIVDPYADANLLTEFAVLAPEGVGLLVLADQASHKPGLRSAAAAWIEQHGPSRPLQVRLAPVRTLHDRLIIVDEREAWTLGQSFNALATRAPTSLIRSNPETASLKVEAYRQIWDAATTLT